LLDFLLVLFSFLCIKLSILFQIIKKNEYLNFLFVSPRVLMGKIIYIFLRVYVFCLLFREDLSVVYDRIPKQSVFCVQSVCLLSMQHHSLAAILLSLLPYCTS
jgi:hypothetical protein